jgi:hypothetical protein
VHEIAGAGGPGVLEELGVRGTRADVEPGRLEAHEAAPPDAAVAGDQRLAGHHRRVRRA